MEQKEKALKNKETFIRILRENVHREGLDALIDYLENKSDFFTSPASTRFHGSYEGGLCEHSLNVYIALCSYFEARKAVYGLHFSAESIAISALLHDTCKAGCYKPGYRNVKDENGVWQKVPTYTFEDPLPYGHGEKSVYIVSSFMRLSREEAFAIRYHMGFSGSEDARNVGKAFEQFPLAFALSVADMEATYFVEGTPKS